MVSVFFWSDGTPANVSVADSGGNTWANMIHQSPDPSATERLRVGVSWAVAGSTGAVNVTGTLDEANSFRQAFVLVYSAGTGVGLSQLIQYGSLTNETDTLNIGSVAALTDDLILEVVGHFNGAATFSAGSGFTSRAAVGLVDGADKVAVSDGSYPIDGTLAEPDTFVMFGLVFSEAPALPAITAPLTMDNDNPTQAITGVMLSTSIADNVRAQVLVGDTLVREVEFPTTNRTVNQVEIDFKAGYEQARASNAQGFEGLPRTDGLSTERVRWAYKGDDSSDIYFDFNLLTPSGFTSYRAPKSEIFNDPSTVSIFDNVSSFMSEDDLGEGANQITTGTPSPLNIDYFSVNSPGPNFLGGDSETFDGTITQVWYSAGRGECIQIAHDVHA